MRDAGALTDPQFWERAWRGARTGRRSSALKRRLIEDHHGVLRTLLDRASPDGRALELLELGCAPGRLLQALAEVGPHHHLSGVDFAEQALTRTRLELERQGIRAALHLADVREFTPPVPYDLVVSFGLIEHFTDPVEILTHHVRLVRPGGHVAVTVPNYSDPLLVRALRTYSPETLATHNLEIMSRAALQRALADAGLTNIVTGDYGGALMPSARARATPLGRAAVALASAWNVTMRLAPRVLNPWQGFLWAMGTRAAR